MIRDNHGHFSKHYTSSHIYLDVITVSPRFTSRMTTNYAGVSMVFPRFVKISSRLTRLFPRFTQEALWYVPVAPRYIPVSPRYAPLALRSTPGGVALDSTSVVALETGHSRSQHQYHNYVCDYKNASFISSLLNLQSIHQCG